MIIYRLATLTDVAQLHELETLHVNAELSSYDPSLQAQGLSRGQLESLIEQHWIMLALNEQTIIGYVIAAKWSFFAKQSLYQKMIALLPNINISQGQFPVKVTIANSCQYGPIWIDQQYRGQGIFAKLVDGLASKVKINVRFLVAYIAEDNERSFKAHTQYADMQVVDYFSFQQRDFYLLIKAV
ncbi:GNAT family N-acetyltransferase [Shewanella aestuarii]|uniref:GNAT family N-acetyltransferase n=1 Tax=Shewanella aestuarii TaxID=1028752 RepID=A0A6G9QN90_9GAMM|nr:GNAT family N-acetyltransferase [Shewanella aestuarii]QIR15535.1 GNAT family N-acetyltransferase [Shewanella aestuarii]